MHELVRGKSGYTIVRRGDRGVNPHSGGLRSAATGTGAVELVRSTWKQFVRTGSSDLEEVHEPIRDSWKRCFEMGVDPAHGKCWDIRQDRELGDGFLQLRDLVEETKTQIYSLVRGMGLLVTVSDRRGYLVSMCGDYETLLGADRLNFGPGANWSEGSVGTNAIGTALAGGEPIQVAGPEHFCEDHHRWVCSAAPIYDLQGEVIGCLDISGPMAADHSHAMALAIRGARAIEGRLFKNEALELRHQSSHLVHSIFNAVMTGLLYLDSDGIIKAANPIAAVQLGGTEEQLKSLDARRYFAIGEALRQLRLRPSKYESRGLPVRCRKSSLLSGQIFPMLSRNRVLAGVLLVLHEQQGIVRSISSNATLERDPFAEIIGESKPLKAAINLARRVAGADTTVLITGESGTGKDLLANALHKASRRSKGPFVVVNCGAIPQDLIQSILFGYVEGAFTGARRKGSPGQFELASGGTLFLDEIGEMPLPMQVNLLRVLEDSEVTRVGGTRPVPVDVRVIAASNKDLDREVARGSFRHDLYYRLNVIRIDLPPIRQRDDDIELLASHFIGQLAKKLGRPVRRIDPDFFFYLKQYHWPGNSRELHHAIEGGIALMNDGILSCDCLPDSIRAKLGESITPESSPLTFNLQELQRQAILQAHEHYAGNISQMAKALGIGRNTLYAKLRKFGVL